MAVHRLTPAKTITDRTGRKICEVLGAADGHDDLSVAWILLPAGCPGVAERNDFAEVVIVLSGSGVASVDGETQTVGAGHSIYVPKGALWHLENAGGEPLVCYSVCAPAFRPELSHPFES